MKFDGGVYIVTERHAKHHASKNAKQPKAVAQRGVPRPPSAHVYNLNREVRSERSREPVVSRSPTPIETLDGHFLHLGLISINLRNK